MARTTGFTFTNTAQTGAIIKLTKINEKTDYGVTADEPNQCTMTNTTAPVGQEELITNFCNPISKVNTSLEVANPSPVKSGIQYGVKLEATCVTTDDADSTYEVDEPIVVQISVRHGRSTNITSALVDVAVQRAISAFYGNLFSSSNDHIAQLMRSALQPMPDFAS